MSQSSEGAPIIPEDLKVDYQCCGEPYVVPASIEWAIERDKNMQKFARKLIERIGRVEADLAAKSALVAYLEAELDKGDSWAWIRSKFERSGERFRWYRPRTDSLVGTRYEVMGWLHCLFADASPKVYIDIALEHQKQADDAHDEIARLKVEIAELQKARVR
jgi:hypothetical protein